MKKTLQFIAVYFLLFSALQSEGQKAVVIGVNHTTPDGFAFLVTQDLAMNETVYFSEDEYNNSTGNFSSGESVVRFTAGGVITTGTVVFVKETTANTYTVSCTGGGSCGTADHFGGTFSLSSFGETFYAYQDTDTDPSNGVTEIYSAVYTGDGGVPTSGGSIPAAQDPTTGTFSYPNAILLDGFPAMQPDRFEYVFNPVSLRDGVSKVNLENTANYLYGQANADLSTVEFTNLNLSGANPSLIVTRSPASVVENSGSPITYTFTLSAPNMSPTIVNFSVGGSAVFSTDYTVSGATSFMASSGTITIPTGMTTAGFTITPSGDTDLEPDETVIITAIAGMGYDVGSPGSATGTITNDDVMAIIPTVAVTGLNNSTLASPGIEGFSFVALVDITAGTEIYFTEEEFNNNALAFSPTNGEGVVKWTAPSGGVLRGEVIVAAENTPDTFTATCDSGNCGIFTTISTGFAFSSEGEGFFAYSDSDSDPANGIIQVHSVLYTGAVGSPGGNIPAMEDPSVVYTGSVVVDGFPAVEALRTEYRHPAERMMDVDQADFQNTANWFNAQPPATLSDVPFTNIIISTGSMNPNLSVAVSPASVVEDSGTDMVYTFSLSAMAPSDITINFDVTGSADFMTDYTASGALTFTSMSGTAEIPMGMSSVDVTITPVVDTDVETSETVEIMIASGTGYNGGSPNSATGSITNDDTSDSDPLVAIMGMTHDDATPDAFSFAAAQDIPGGEVVYFTEKEFDNTTLLFAIGEAVLQWTAPAGGINRGDVIVATETGAMTKYV